MLIAPHVRGMQPYAPIVPLDVLSRRLGLPPERIVKLDANENPYGTSPRALEALARSRDLHIYPDPDQTALREALARVHRRADGAHPVRRRRRRGDRPAGARVRRAGPDGRSTCRPPSACTSGRPTCSAAGYIVGAAPSPTSPWTSTPWRAPCARFEASGAPPKLLFVTNPNNPDGSVTTRARTCCGCSTCRSWSWWTRPTSTSATQQSLAPLVPERDNLIVLRTFSKLAGMAGVRVGYGVFPLPVIRHLWKVKQPYTPNVAGSIMAIAAMQDREWLDQQRDGASPAERRAARATRCAALRLAHAAAEPHQLRAVPGGRRPRRARA